VELTIDPRFNGPPDSAHGGYVSGLVAGLLDGPARVRLHRPPPLGRALVVHREGGAASLADGETVIATGTLAEVDVTVPAPVGFDQADLASQHYPGLRDHAFPRCFACGPARAAGDGLRIFPGPVPGRDLVAAPWISHSLLADSRGDVPAEFLWAALDCPSGWAAIVATGRPLMLLGEMTGRLLGSVRAGERCVVMGWVLGGPGRKHVAGAAILGEDGTPRALARATWIATASP
jgi:hypothetical protein